MLGGYAKKENNIKDKKKSKLQNKSKAGIEKLDKWR